MLDEQATRSFYQEDSITYDSRWHSPGGNITNRAQIRLVQSVCSGWAHRRVLEVGCGTGRFSEVLARIGADLTIADLAPAMLSVTVERLKREGLESRLRAAECASIYQLPFDDDSFDCAFMLNVVGHLRDTQLALNEISRVLRPNGTLLVNFPNLYSIYFPAGARVNRQAKAVGQDVYSRWFRPCDMTSALAAAGLSIVDWYGHVHVPRSLHTNRWVAAMIGSLDCASRHTWLRHLAPVRFCLCRKSETTQ